MHHKLSCFINYLISYQFMTVNHLLMPLWVKGQRALVHWPHIRLLQVTSYAIWTLIILKWSSNTEFRPEPYQVCTLFHIPESEGEAGLSGQAEDEVPQTESSKNPEDPLEEMRETLEQEWGRREVMAMERFMGILSEQQTFTGEPTPHW